MPGNRSACCSQHHWMVSWRSQDWEVKSDYCPNKWRECARGYGGTLCNCKTLHTTSGGGHINHWTLNVFSPLIHASFSLISSSNFNICNYHHLPLEPSVLSGAMCPSTFASLILVTGGVADLAADLYTMVALIAKSPECCECCNSASLSSQNTVVRLSEGKGYLNIPQSPFCVSLPVCVWLWEKSDETESASEAWACLIFNDVFKYPPPSLCLSQLCSWSFHKYSSGWFHFFKIKVVEWNP